MSDDGFFSGGAKGITWPDQPPAKVRGIIEQIFPKEEIMTIATPTKPSEPTGKFQKRVILQTDLRDRDIEDDDGRRTLYIKSWMRSAVAQALRQVGVKDLQVGGDLTVEFTHTEPSERPVLSPSKHFKAEYVPPTEQFFGGSDTVGSAGVSNNKAAPEPERPESIDAVAWAAMDASTKQAVANTFSQMPPF